MVERLEHRPQFDQSWREGEVYRVCDIQQETADAVSVFLEPTSFPQRRYQFLAGQYLNLRFDIGQQTCVRCYSLSNAPDEGVLRITVKRIEDGLVSRHIMSGLQVGNLVTGDGAHGDFTIRDPARAFLGIAAGSGITPIMSMLKDMLQHSSAVCRLLYVTPDRGNAIFHDELADLVSAHPDRLMVHHWHTRERGRLGASQLEQYLRQLAGDHEPDVYLCGPGAWMEQVRLVMQRSPGRFGGCYQEFFVSDSGPLSSLSENDRYHEVVLENAGEVHRLSVAESQTILAGARIGGIDLPSGCEQGKCGSCMARCISGEVELGNTGFLTEGEIRQGYILCCQARPTAPCVVVADV